MTSRDVLITNRAQVMRRIEAVLPEKVVEGLPTKTEERQIALLDYVAGMLERHSATQRAAKESEEMQKAEPTKVEPAKTNASSKVEK